MPAGSGPFGKSRTRNGRFGVRDGENDGHRTRIERFGVRDRGNDGCRTRIARFGVRDGLKG